MKIDQTHGLPNPCLYEIFKRMISLCENPMSHTVKRCKFSASIVASLDGSVAGSKIRHPPGAISCKNRLSPYGKTIKFKWLSDASLYGGVAGVDMRHRPETISWENRLSLYGEQCKFDLAESLSSPYWSDFNPF
jgi:hypothetical protein